MTQALTSGSTVPRRQLGRYLRNARGHAGLTVRAAAKILEWSEPRMWRIETGQVALRSHDVRLMCETYAVGPEHTDALVALAGETKAKGWWQAYGNAIPKWFNVYIGLEEAAEDLRKYESVIVPGLLQTPDYARAIIGAVDLDDQEVTRRVDLRMARQSVVLRPVAATPLTVVLDEAAVRRPVGGSGVLAAQCRHLAEVSERENIDLRVLPFRAGSHRGLTTGSFTILRFPTKGDGTTTEPTTVYVEGYTGALYLDQADEIDEYENAFAGIRATAADPAGTASRDLLWRLAQEVDR